jgi:DeoR/GlpR family transcriptional regulator of sugar metabolism
MADIGKAGRFAPHTFAEPAQITGLITDTGTDKEDIARRRAAGAEVRTARAGR